jgi:hypothetical protein
MSEGKKSPNHPLRLKAEMIMAIRDYEKEATHRHKEGIDFVASQAESDDKVLLRVITKPRGRSGTVGVDVVDEMVDTMKREDYDKGILISERFSTAAKEEMRREDIQMISEDFAPRLEPVELYFKMREYVDSLCKAKCGQVPEKKSDCKGISEGHHTCKIRLIINNASFHFERGWVNLLKQDFNQLISIRNQSIE